LKKLAEAQGFAGQAASFPFMPIHGRLGYRTLKIGYRSHAQRCADTSGQTKGSKLQAF